MSPSYLGVHSTCYIIIHAVAILISASYLVLVSWSYAWLYDRYQYVPKKPLLGFFPSSIDLTCRRLSSLSCDLYVSSIQYGITYCCLYFCLFLVCLGRLIITDFVPLFLVISFEQKRHLVGPIITVSKHTPEIHRRCRDSLCHSLCDIGFFFVPHDFGRYLVGHSKYLPIPPPSIISY